jgi:hypothetical protein
MIVHVHQLHVEVENKDVVAVNDFRVVQAGPDLWLVSLNQLIHPA